MGASLMATSSPESSSGMGMPMRGVYDTDRIVCSTLQQNRLQRSRRSFTLRFAAFRHAPFCFASHQNNSSRPTEEILEQLLLCLPQRRSR